MTVAMIRPVMMTPRARELPVIPNARGLQTARTAYDAASRLAAALITARRRLADATQRLTVDHLDESLRQHAFRLSQRLKNVKMVGTVYRQQMAGKASLDPCLGILDGLPA